MKKISKKQYLAAFIITTTIFLIGIALGLTFEKAKLDKTEEMVLEESIQLKSFNLQKEFLKQGKISCNVISSIIGKNMDNLAHKMSLIESYSESSWNEEQFKLRLRDYFLTEIEFYNIIKEIENECGESYVKIIYFYDDNKYDTQGDILSYLKKLYPNKILTFNYLVENNNEPNIEILRENYEIEMYPSLVINEKVYQGHQEVEFLQEVICEELEKINESC